MRKLIEFFIFDYYSLYDVNGNSDGVTNANNRKNPITLEMQWAFSY